MDKEIIKDFGEITVPTSWDEVTLEQYQKIEQFYEDKDRNFNVLDVIDIFIDRDKDYIMSLPSEFLEIILDKLTFLYELPEKKKPSNKITIDGEDYVINFQNKLKVGEYVASNALLKADKHNYAGLLAILCRKDGEIYDSMFENEILEDRVKLFQKQPITKILPLIGFFLSCFTMLQIPSQLSFQVREGISHIVSNIETLQRNGEISKRSMKRLTKKLQKLQESINFT